MKKINLDALIPRENLAGEGIDQMGTFDAIRLSDLREGPFMTFIRKPDFQRETKEWDSSKIIGLIETFIKKELIPQVILWKSEKNLIFVLDGAHRLSALMAWANNDYGDGEISKKFFGDISNDDQRDAQKLRSKINDKIGKFEEHDELLMHNIKNAWQTGTYEEAERAFFRINQNAVAINQIEKILLLNRKRPDGISCRAIITKGKAIKYWEHFVDFKSEAITLLGKRINEKLFSPILNSNSIRTNNLPILGRQYNVSAQLIYNLAAISNDLIPPKFELPNDRNGDTTLNFLKNILTTLNKMNDNTGGSFGFNPLVYYYSMNGNHLPTFFTAMILLTRKMLKSKVLANKFTQNRLAFEEFLINNEDRIQFFVRNYRGTYNSFPKVLELFEFLINQLDEPHYLEEKLKEKYDFLKSFGGYRNIIKEKNFPPDAKNQIFYQNMLENTNHCKICKGYLIERHSSVDHIIRKKDDGNGNPENGQLTHAFCDNIYKN